MPWAALLGYGLGGVATRVPSAFGVVFLAIPRLPLTVAIGLHLTVGALAAAGGWAWAHYLDLVGLQAPVFARLRGRLERLILLEAVVVGAAVGALALAIVYGWAPRGFTVTPDPGVVILLPPTFADPWPYAWALPALAVSLSVLAAAQATGWPRDPPAPGTIGGPRAGPAAPHPP